MSKPHNNAETSKMTASPSSQLQQATDHCVPILNHASVLLRYANQHSSPIQAWETVFPSGALPLSSLFGSLRHRYTRTELTKLRHNRRTTLPIDRSCLKPESYSDVSYSDALPSFPFTSAASNTLTADVLLSASESSLTFSDLNLSPSIVSALSALGLTRPSPVQLRTLPRTRLGSDVIAHAKSGTGKTLAYALAIIDAYISSISSKAQPLPSTSASPIPSTSPQAIVLTPTRELATQVYQQFQSICSRVSSSSTPLNVALFVGGVDERQNTQTLAQTAPVFIIGTPGRIRALINTGALPVHAINIMVLDEADRLLNNNFVAEVRSICVSLPDSRQTLAFSATFNPSLRRILLQIMNNPAYITCDVHDVTTNNESTGKTEGSQNSHPRAQEHQMQNQADEDIVETQKAILLGVRQTKLDLNVFASTKSNPARIQALRCILRTYAHTLCIVFVNSRKEVSSIEGHLKSPSLKCRGIFAGMKQSARNGIIDAVRKGDIKVLISTDLLARGVDFPSCDLVVQVGLPLDVATYLHRVGRAGRFGGQGRAISLYGLYDDQMSMGSLERKLGFAMQPMDVDLSSCGVETTPSYVVDAPPNEIDEVNMRHDSLQPLRGDTAKPIDQQPSCVNVTPMDIQPASDCMDEAETENNQSVSRPSSNPVVISDVGTIGPQSALIQTTCKELPITRDQQPSNEIQPGASHVTRNNAEAVGSPPGQADLPVYHTHVARSPQQVNRSGPTSQNLGTIRQGQKRPPGNDINPTTVTKKQRDKTPHSDGLGYQPSNWEQIARSAEKRGYDEAYSRAFRIAFELCRKLV